MFLDLRVYFMLLELLLNLQLSNHSFLIFSYFYLLSLLLTWKKVLLKMLLKDFSLTIICLAQASLVPLIFDIVSIHILAEFADLVLRKEGRLVERLFGWIKLIFYN